MSDDTPTSDNKLSQVLEELSEVRKALRELLRHNQELTEELRERNRRIEELEEENEKLRRAAKRQAAPFRRAKSKKKPKAKHKRAGRKQGHRGSRRRVPSDDDVDRSHEVPLDCCPCCGKEELSDLKPVVQYVEDVEVRPVIHRIQTFSGTCVSCGRVRSRHPLQVSEATGAAGVQLGPQAIALAIDLNKRLGMSTRKACEVLDTHFGLSLSPGGLVQATHRMADRLRDDYEALIDELLESSALYVDETSWWVGEPGWWLWTFTNDEDVTVYRVEPQRSREVVEETLGEEFGGVLSSDCLNIYDGLRYTQNKCYAHHLRAVSDALKRRPNSTYLRDVRLLLKMAMAARPQTSQPVSHELRARFEKWADRLLASERDDVVEEKVRGRLVKQRDHLFTFLEHPEVDPTNNAAERALRPAVIARKISCGNRTIRGKQSWEILTSVSTSCAQRGEQSFAATIRRAARLAPVRPNAPPS